MQLKEYQQEAATGIVRSLREHDRTVLIMPTGTGKTVVFSEIIRRCLKAEYRTLVLAHRNELIDQAIDRIYEYTGYMPTKEKAADRADRDNLVVVASIQTMQGDRLGSWPQDHFRLIVVDEAHHAVADSYQKALRHFRALDKGATKVLGVTATPDRADDQELGSVFEDIAHQYSLVEAIEQRQLVRIVGKRVTSFKVDLSGLRTVNGDFQISDLDQVVEEAIGPMTQAIKQETSELKSLIFLPSVRASEMVSLALEREGIAATYLDGSADPTSRRATLESFRTGRITHLCNCSLFLEGFDEPSIECVVMARPTLSRTVYAQAVGRGTRLHPGKSELTLLEFTYNSAQHKLVTAYELFASKGYDDKVRAAAEKMPSDGQVDFLDRLEQAHNDRFAIERIMERLRLPDAEVKTWDPLAVADLADVDLSGELQVEWQGYKLRGAATPRQLALLGEHGMATSDPLFNDEKFGKARASTIISLIADNGWDLEAAIERMIGDRQSSRFELNGEEGA